jgi:DNA-damage-inducible protein D
MKKEDLQKYQETIFEQYKNFNEFGNEYWSARDFYKILQYSQWKSFINVIEKAKKSCENSNQSIDDHFQMVPHIVKIGSGAEKDIKDIQLSRYACYLIVQNADPSKSIIALGQTYFAVQTRKQEIKESSEYNNLETESEKRIFLREEMKKHNKKLAAAAKDAGVNAGLDYAIFQDHGYKGLYGGLSAKDIHAAKGLKKNQKILDHMGSTELAANLFRATQTEEKLKRDKIKVKDQANKTHYFVGKKVRETIEELGGTMPEKLPNADSIKKIEQERTKQMNEKNDEK